MKKPALFLVVFLLALVLSSCDSLPLVANGPAAQEGVLLSDDFSNPNSGWDTWSSNGSLVAYQDGSLRIFINEPQFDYWSRPGKRFDDVRIAVEATRVAGPDDNDYGILCRYKDQDNFYAFLVSSDQYAGIMKVKDGNYQLISGENLQFFDVINSGEKTNFLGADCTGSRLIFYVNGTRLLEANDTDFSAGEVGLIAGTYEIPGVDIRFDNFVVSRP